MKSLNVFLKQLINLKMTEGNFVDYVKVNVRSGNGGKGSSHFRREKYVAKGGPDGGDGGRGGHVIIIGNKSLWTLYHFKHKRHFKSEHGGDGSRNRSSGTDGKDLHIEVPIGTIIRNSETNENAFIYQLLRLCDADLAQFINPNGTIKKEWPKSFINKQNQRITFEYHRLMTIPNTYRLDQVNNYIKEKLKDLNNHEHNLLFPIQLSTLISGYELSIDEIVPDNTPVEDIQHISNPYIHHPTLGWKIRFQDLYDPRLEFSHLRRSGESISLQTPVIRQIKSAAKADSSI
mgnify:CR=1 FL=1